MVTFVLILWRTEKPLLDAAGVCSPWLWVHWGPCSGNPAWVEEVGLEAVQVGSRREGGGASIWPGLLEGVKTWGGGDTNGVWMTVGDWNGKERRKWFKISYSFPSARYQTLKN